MTTAAENELLRPRPVLDLRPLMLRAAMVGIGAVLVAIIVSLFRNNRHEFMHAYLVAYLFWFGLTMGCLALAMLYNVVGGRWGDVARPVLRAGAMAVPLMAVLFIPILLDLQSNYPWARHDWVALGGKFYDKTLAHQHDKWLNAPAVVTRYVIYFVIWTGLALIVNGALRRRTVESGPPASLLAKLCAPGLPLYGITMTLAAIDWAMSVEPRWYSTLFGLLVITGQGLSAFAFAVLATMLISERLGRVHKTKDEFGQVSVTMGGGGEPAQGPIVKPTDFGDLGNLMLAFTMLWAYMSLSQYLIIWSGNMPSEIQYYVPRIMTGWKFIGLLLILLHFFLPFLMLLSRNVKRSGSTLGRLAAVLLVMRVVDWIWWIEPSVQHHMTPNQEMHLHGAWVLLDILLPIGLGGIWVAYVAWQLHGRDVLPPIVVEEEHGGHGPHHPHAIAPHHGGISPALATARVAAQPGGH